MVGVGGVVHGILPQPQQGIRGPVSLLRPRPFQENQGIQRQVKRPGVFQAVAEINPEVPGDVVLQAGLGVVGPVGPCGP